MKSILTWVIIFILGFIVGAGVGFKILEGVSWDLLIQARDNSYNQFQKAYPWSTAQKQLNQKIEEQKKILMQEIKKWLKKYLLTFINIEASSWSIFEQAAK